LILTSIGDPTTSESGALTSTVRLQLTSQPTAPVLVAVKTDKPYEATAEQTLVSFHPDAWNVPQEVKVRAPPLPHPPIHPSTYTDTQTRSHSHTHPPTHADADTLALTH
jgi:hypothetical protein